MVQHNLSVLELRTDESFQEYLSIYFKVPRLTRLTPLARVFDFIATGVPGPRDMLVVGKIAYEERRKEAGVDAGVGPDPRRLPLRAASVESHLAAAHAMLTLVRGGVIRAQVEWIDALIRDPRRTTVVLCALPEEMPVIEAIELHDRLRAGSGVAVDVCILNRAMTEPVTAAHRRFMTAAARSRVTSTAVSKRLGGSPVLLEAGIDLEARLYDDQHPLHAPAAQPPADAGAAAAGHRRASRASPRRARSPTRSPAGSRERRRAPVVTAERGDRIVERREARAKSRRARRTARIARGRDLLRQRRRRQDDGQRRPRSSRSPRAEDKRVLVLTVDPARRLATALGIKGIGAEPVRVPKARLQQSRDRRSRATSRRRCST